MFVSGAFSVVAETIHHWMKIISEYFDQFTWTQRARTSAKRDNAFGGYRPRRAGSARASKALMS